MAIDYMNYDSLSVAVKADVADDFKRWYGAFGWDMEKSWGDKHKNIVHMDFSRPHKIENKDRLQLLQVRFEMMANLIARAGRRAKIDTSALAAMLFVLGAALIAGGVVLVAWAGVALHYTLGIISAAAGVLLLAISPLLCRFMYAGKDKKYTSYVDVLMDNVTAVVKEAAALTGFDYGNKE